MSAPFSTLALNDATWDLELDGSDSIAVLTLPADALAQDVASAALTFYQEVYYDTTLGVRYKQDILGNRPPLTVLKSQIEGAALTVPYVASAQLIVTAFANRQVGAQIQFVDDAGNPGQVNL